MNDSKKKEIKAGKGKKFKVKNKDKSKEFEIEIVQEKFDDDKDKKDSLTAKIDAKITSWEVNDGKRKDDTKSEEGQKKLDVEYKKGTFISSLELKKVNDIEIDGKKNIRRDYHWPFWTLIVVGTLAIVGLITWWVMASRKEEKEEGDL